MDVDGGAFSTGPMVPVLASNDEGRSRAILELLEGHGIPAVLDVDVDGFVGLHEPVPDGWNQVLVPFSMRADALEVLHQEDLEAPRRRSTSPAFEIPRPTGRSPRQPNPLTETPRRVDPLPPTAPGYGPLDPGEDEREELRLPDPSPVQGRIQMALAAIAFGGFAQRGLEQFFGADVVRRALGAHDLLDGLHRAITAAFLHGGPSHFLSNAAFGLVFGVVLFGTHRAGATALVWLVASVVGFSAELGLSSEALVVIGASAGNYGLVGLWTRGQLERAQLALLPRREALKTLGILLLLLPGAITPFSSTGTRIAVLAHVGGFVAGYFCGFVFHRRLLPSGFENIDERSRWAGVVAMSATATAWGLGLASLS